MTLRHLRIFTEVYRQSSVTKAADALHLSQPSVSLALKELETHYGVRLFERFGRHISPTGDGQEFYGYALHIVSLFDDMEKQMRRGSAGSLRVGTSITVGTHILPALLQRCKADFPTLQTTAVIANSGDIEQLVRTIQWTSGSLKRNPPAQTSAPNLLWKIRCVPSFRPTIRSPYKKQSRLRSLLQNRFSCGKKAAARASFWKLRSLCRG